MPWKIEFTPSAERDLRNLDKQIQTRILRAIAGLAPNPRQSPNVKTLQGQDNFRLRVGDWRVIFSLQNEILTVLVLQIGHRREIYR